MANVNYNILQTGKIALKQLQKMTDLEEQHIKADDILLAMIGDDEIRELFEQVSAWYA